MAPALRRGAVNPFAVIHRSVSNRSYNARSAQTRTLDYASLLPRYFFPAVQVTSESGTQLPWVFSSKREDHSFSLFLVKV
jgi:hypothetical protein